MSGKLELHYAADSHTLVRQFYFKHHELFSEESSFLYLVRDRFRLQAVQRGRLSERGDMASPDHPFLTIPGFINLLFEKLNISKIPLNFEQRLLILQKIAKKLTKNFRYFNFSEQSFPGAVLVQILIFFDEIRMDDNDDLLIEQAGAANSIHLTDRLTSDLSLLFREYGKLFETQYLDEAGLLKEILHEISPDFFQQYFPSLKFIVLEDVSNFKELHIRLIKKIKSYGYHISLQFVYGQNQEIFRHKQNLWDRFNEMTDVVYNYDESQQLSQSLFKMADVSYSLIEKISISPAVNRMREVENLAGQIKRLVVDGGYQFSQIAVASPKYPAYQSLIEATFSRHEIPHSNLVPNVLEQSLPIQHLLLLIKLPAEGYPLRLIEKILDSPFLIYGHSLKHPYYKKMLSQLRVHSGQNEILEQLKKQFYFYSAEEQETESEDLHMEIYHRLVAVLDQLFSDASFFEESHTASEYYNYVGELIQSYGFTSRMLKYGSDLQNKGVADQMAGLSQFLESLNNWAVTSSALDPAHKYTIDNFLDLLQTLNKTVNYQPKRPQKYGVQIIPFYQLHQTDASAVFILGMEDDAFPKNSSNNFTHPQNLTGKFRSYIQENELYRDREFFLQIVNLPIDKLQFSYPRYHQDNPILPSLFLRELRRISDITDDANDNYRLFTSSDILETISDKVVQADQSSLDWKKIPTFLQKFLSIEMVDFFNFRLNVERKRQQIDQQTKWEGMLDSDNLAKAWLNDFFGKRSFSATQLERYAYCPMIYFFERILDIEFPEQADEFFTPLDRGIVVHNILFRFYREISPKKQTLDTLLQITEEELDKIPVPKSILWQLEKEFYTGNSQHQGLLPAFWEYEQNITKQSQTVPTHFELSFGNEHEQPNNVDPYSVEEPFKLQSGGEEFRFRGKIDRVEIGGNGELLVVDYKTGTIPNLKSMWEGEVLQLPIYLKAGHHILEQKYENLEKVGGAIYLLKKAKEIQKKILFWDQSFMFGEPEPSKSALIPNDKYSIDNTPATLDDFIERSLNFATGYIRDIRRGRFPHTSEKKNCIRWDGTQCDFLPLCRVNWFKQGKLA